MPSHAHGLAILSRRPTTVGFDWRDAFGIAHTGGKLVLNLFGAGALAAPLETLENREGLLPEWAGGKPLEAPAAAPVVVPAPPKQDTAYWLAKLQERQQIAAGASRVDILKAKADAAGKMRDQLAALKRPVVVGADREPIGYGIRDGRGYGPYGMGYYSDPSRRDPNALGSPMSLPYGPNGERLSEEYDYYGTALNWHGPRKRLPGCHVLGATAARPAPAGITDKATVSFVQAQLKALASGTRNKALDPGPVDGLLGQATRAAVAAFNKAYGWPDDGTAITAGTIEALARPDVRSFTNASVADFTSEAGDVVTASRPMAPAPVAIVSAPGAAPAPASASTWPLWAAGGLTAFAVAVVINEVRR